LLTAILLSSVLVIIIGDPMSLEAAQSAQNDANAPLAAAPSATFDVASIRLSGPDERGSGLRTYPGARVVGNNMTVRYLIAEAYHVDESQIVGGPAWIDNERFHIEAKPPDNVAAHFTAPHDPLTAPPDEIRQMLQNLLAERFQLKVDIKQDNGRIYELVRNGRPLNLNPPKDKTSFPYAGAIARGVPDGAGLRGQNISMSELAARLTGWLKCPVIDRTGLSDSYDFLVRSESEDTGLGVTDGMIQSLHGLGLDLINSTGRVYKLAVKQVSLPSSN
jgi:uncharacterized protein (TIGR03435 family)